MKTLVEYITERVDDPKSYIKANIDNVSDETADHIVKIMQQSGSIDKEKIIQYMAERGIEDCWKMIIRILRDDNDDYSNFVQLINGELNVPDSDKFIKGNDYHKLFKGVFSDDTLEELYNLNIARNGIARGRGEILCRLILKDANNGAGDLSTSKGTFELKANGGRLRGNTSITAISFNDATKKILGNNFATKYPNIAKYGVFANEENLCNWMALMKEGVDENTFAQRVAEVLISQYNDKGPKSDIEKIVKSEGYYNNDDVKDYKSSFHKLVGSVQLYFYHNTEKFDYIVVGYPKKGLSDYVCIKGADLSSVGKIFKNNKIDYVSWPRIGGAQDAAVKIYKA